MAAALAPPGFDDIGEPDAFGCGIGEEDFDAAFGSIASEPPDEEPIDDWSWPTKAPVSGVVPPDARVAAAAAPAAMGDPAAAPACPYCGHFARLVGGDVIYPHRPDLSELWFWQCAPCDAHVG